jgi:hypothetical protein
MSTRTLAVFLATLASLGCGGSDSSTGPKANGISIVEGADVSDTVQARPLQPLVVEVREGGRTRPGVVVRFETLPVADTTRRSEYSIITSAVAQDWFSTSTSDTTDASGRASVLVQLGTVAGEVKLLLSAPALGLTDTAHFTVRPGRVAKLVMTAQDKELVYGGSYDIDAAAADRFGNRRPDALTFSSGSALATVDATGKVQAGQETGQGIVVVGSGGIVDTARFTVIPRVNLTFVYGRDDGWWIGEGALDGSSIRPRDPTQPPGYPSPSPSSASIAFQRPSGPQYKIFVVDSAGTERDLLQGAAFISAYYPRYSADGGYIYFGGRDSTGYGVWRVHPDGSALERIVGTTSDIVSPGISPDGSRIAYSDYDSLYVLTVATGAKASVGAPAAFPVFSPDGQRLAYFNSAGIAVANSDGTSQRQLNIPRIMKADAGLAWLPDSKWLITRDWYTPILVNAGTGESFALQKIGYSYQIAVER